VYLSGGMQHAADLGTGWRKDCTNRLAKLGYNAIDIADLDIAYTEQYGELYRSLDNDNTEEALQIKSNIRSHFVYTDLKLVTDDSDAVIVLYDESARRGAGTISECQVAFLHDIPVFLVNAYPSIKDVPGWLQALTTKMFPNFVEMYDYMSLLPFGILRRDQYGNHHGGSHYLCSLCGDPFEKQKTHFVSKISPLYCKPCVEIVKTTREQREDRYHFFRRELSQIQEL
jgi:hypothetical protein